ncbi:MAG: hypothetical protein ACXVEE_02085 [Polyangiales bacterium]
MILAWGCSGKTVVESTTDATASDALEETTLVDSGTIDSGTPESSLIDAMPDSPPSSCTDPIDPENPPVGCSPEGGGATVCTSTSMVSGCPMGNPCMANSKPTGMVLDHRIGRMRFFAPTSLLSLAPIAFDPNVNPACFLGGTENLSTLLRIDRGAHSFTIGNSHPSTDGKTFSFSTESIDGAAIASSCPGFTGPTAPISLAPVSVTYTEASGLALAAKLPLLNLAVFGSSPLVMPLRDVVVRVPSFGTDGQCIGSWSAKYWCDGDTLGWTDGGSLVGHVTLEDADRIPVKSAGCQSLCAILVNDATKTVGGLCKRGADGKIPESGDSCVGGTSCKNAFTFSLTFASYATPIVP